MCVCINKNYTYDLGQINIDVTSLKQEWWWLYSHWDGNSFFTRLYVALTDSSNFQFIQSSSESQILEDWNLFLYLNQIPVFVNQGNYRLFDHLGGVWGGFGLLGSSGCSQCLTVSGQVSSWSGECSCISSCQPLTSVFSRKDRKGRKGGSVTTVKLLFVKQLSNWILVWICHLTTDFNEKCLKIFVNQEFIACASGEMTQVWFITLLKQFPNVAWLEVFGSWYLHAIGYLISCSHRKRSISISCTLIVQWVLEQNLPLAIGTVRIIKLLQQRWGSLD